MVLPGEATKTRHLKQRRSSTSPAQICVATDPPENNAVPEKKTTLGYVLRDLALQSAVPGLGERLYRSHREA